MERCDVGSAELRALLRSYLQPMLDAGADTLVLGCTHYPFLDAAIREIVGDRLTLIDTSVAIARQLERVLDQHGLRAARGKRAPCSAPFLFDRRRHASAATSRHPAADRRQHVEQVLIPSRRTAAPDSQAA